MVPAALRGLGKPEGAAAHLVAGRNGVLRLLHYPVIPDWFELTDHDPETDAAGRHLITRDHIDTGVLSVLWQDDQGGLQMQGRDGAWREVPKLPGVLSVHCGDLLEPIAGKDLAGTHHRVMGGGAERCSIGYFGEPDFTTIIETPDETGRKSYGRYLTDQFPNRFLEPA
jgi:isopenicillin N synthase-like dioxygenase